MAHHRISSTDSKVRAKLHVSIIDSGGKGFKRGITNVTSGPLPLSLLCETSKCNLGADSGAKKDVYSQGMLIPSSAKIN